MSTLVNETVTRMFIEKIEERRAAGENVSAPWRKLWNPALGADRNLVSNKPYRGSNVFITAAQGFGSPFWATAKQIVGAGGSIKLQADGKRVPYTPIVLWVFPDEAQKAAGRFPFVKFFQVWNVEQTDGLEELAASKLAEHAGAVVNPIEAAQAIVDGWHGKPVTTFGSARAAYNPSKDSIVMPDLQAFESAEAFYSTYFHELAHSTGHRTRLNRDGVVNVASFGSHAYSEEELVAEMTAGMLAGHSAIDTPEIVENTSAYLDHWLKVLKANPDILVAAGGQAQKAVDMIRNYKWEKAVEK